jgi:hypothetical protein
LYQYVGSKAVAFVDSQGLFSQSCGGDCVNQYPQPTRAQPAAPAPPAPPPWIPIPVTPPWGPPPPAVTDPNWVDCAQACDYTRRVWMSACLTCTKGKKSTGKAASIAGCQIAADLGHKQCLVHCYGRDEKDYTAPTVMYNTMCRVLRNCKAALQCGTVLPPGSPLPPGMPDPPPGGKPPPPPAPPPAKPGGPGPGTIPKACNETPRSVPSEVMDWSLLRCASSAWFSCNGFTHE